MAERAHDIVLFGATGFTGALTAEYLAAHADSGTRWALAGRNRQKLEAAPTAAGRDQPGVRRAAAAGGRRQATGRSMRALAESTKVVITTVGPYIKYGEPLVAACAPAGTDYVDLTGEPEFVDRMWLRYHEQAQRAARGIVHSCGFDSIPYDLGTLFTVSQLPEGVPVDVQCFVRVGGTFSGGTYHSAINIMGRLREGSRARARAARARDLARRPDGPRQRRASLIAIAVGGWVAPFPTIDPQTVLRSARALDRYGPRLHLQPLPGAQAACRCSSAPTAGAGAVVALAQLPPTRKLLLKLKDPGEGPTRPSSARRHGSGSAWSGRAAGTLVTAEVTGGDPGYGETSKMLAESALCLAHDDLPRTAGQLTPGGGHGPAADRSAGQRPGSSSR